MGNVLTRIIILILFTNFEILLMVLVHCGIYVVLMCATLPNVQISHY